MPHYALLKLSQKFELSQDESAGYLAALSIPKAYQAGEEIARQGEDATHCAVLLDGFACRSRHDVGGDEQILSFVLPGDMCNVESLLLNPFDHTITAQIESRVALIKHADLWRLIGHHPRVGYAFWRDTLIDAAIYREWAVNIGMRNAYARVSHLLCELYVRLKAVGLINAFNYALPLSQQLLAHATGLSVIHVNRTLKRLKDEAIVTVQPRAVRVHDWDRLCAAGEFDPAYLYSKADPA